jgi:hypothetical protein
MGVHGQVSDSFHGLCHEGLGVAVVILTPGSGVGNHGFQVKQLYISPVNHTCYGPRVLLFSRSPVRVGFPLSFEDVGHHLGNDCGCN